MRLIALYSLAILTSSVAVGFSQPSTHSHEMKPGNSPSHGAESATPKSPHVHKKVEIPAGQPIPAVNLVVRPDAMSGWNLEVQVRNFAFAPDRVNTKSTSVNEGHAHLYVNGKKVARLYGPWYHLPTLPPGPNRITVSLNTNDHGDLVHQGQVIQDTAIIQVPTR